MNTVTHVDTECRDYLTGDAVAEPLAVWGDITCLTCRVERGRTL